MDIADMAGNYWINYRCLYPIVAWISIFRVHKTQESGAVI